MWGVRLAANSSRLSHIGEGRRIKRSQPSVSKVNQDAIVTGSVLLHNVYSLSAQRTRAKLVAAQRAKQDTTTALSP